MATTIPKQSTVLVTGITGYIASHVADQFLAAGYKVRGTSRSIEKAHSIKKVLEKRHGAGSVEIVAVADMAKAGAFDEAVKGVSGVAHVASNLSFSDDPNAVIPEVIAGVKSILESSAKEKSIKRFVYTSSSMAATMPKPNKKFTITPQSWNQEAVDKAWGPNFEGRNWAVYGASKVEAEREVWKFVENGDVTFIANAVLPNANFGPRLLPEHGSTSSWAVNVVKGDTKQLEGIPPQWFVDVRDTARLHVLAMTEEDVQYERIFAFSEPYNFTDIAAAVGKGPVGSEDRDLSQVPAKARAVALLKRQGRDGFIGLQESVKANVEGLV